MIIVKYKFDNTTYDLIPTFNSGFTHTHTDVVEGNVTTRTIESDVLPTQIRFGNLGGSSSLLEVLEIDTKNVTTMQSMFNDCNKLTSLDVSNFDTSSVTNMAYMFYNCYALTTLDLSNFDTSSVTSMTYMFYNCNKLTYIGMIYCNTNSVNSIAQNIQYACTIYVDENLINQFNNSSLITYKPYTKIIDRQSSKVLYLNSPLLIGDTIEHRDGKVYHIHRCKEIVFNGSEDWRNFDTVYDNVKAYIINLQDKPKSKGICISSHLPYKFENGDFEHLYTGGELVVFINKSKLSTLDIDGFKQWLANNPMTVVYELASPTYEEIAEGEMQLRIFDDSEIQTYSNIQVSKTNITYPTTIPSVYEISSISDEQDMMLVDMATQMAIMQLTM